MPSAAAQRAAQRVRDRLGVPSTLNGTDAGNVHIAQGVAVVQQNSAGSVNVLKNVATIGRSYEPKPGDVLVHPDGTFTLDQILETNGCNDRFILL